MVTGASGGFGREVSRRLLERGFRVYGLARRFQSAEVDQPGPLVELHCDLTRSGPTGELLQRLVRHERELELLVQCAGLGRFRPHEELSPAEIETMVAVNLLGPMLVTRWLLRRLRENQGLVIQVASIAALEPGRVGSAYAATKAGLLRFGEGILEENRRHGLRLVNLVPGMAPTPFFQDLDFECENDPRAYITPACVGQAVELALDFRSQTVVSQIRLEPLLKKVRKKRPREKGS